MSSQRPHVVLELFKPVSIFLCPCYVDPPRISELVQQASSSTRQANHGELLDLYLEPFIEECLGLRANIQPRLFFLSDLNCVLLALVTELEPAQGSSITFEQILAFNSNFRVCQGQLDRQDTPTVGSEKLEFHLSSGRSMSQVFQQIAEKALGSYRPPEALRRAVTLSIAQFEHVLSDTDLYAFGTIAHSDEIIDPVWASAAVQERSYERWRSAGMSFMVHSYSLVCSCAAGTSTGGDYYDWFSRVFTEDYLRLGARLALERAKMLELRSTLQKVDNLDKLRRLRKDWVNCRRILGVRWTAEGTQRAQIEQTWRQVSGLEKICEEIDRRFEQTVGLFEAEASDRLNQLLMQFQIMITGIAAAGVTAEITHEYGWEIALPWTLGIGVLATFLIWIWLHYRLRRFQR